MTDRELINAAFAASENAWAPYSGFKVGAALLCSDGTVYTGCNIENSSLGVTICAERVALSKAVSDGRRKGFVMLAVAADSESYCMPCGLCRQFISEFSSDIEILSARGDGRYTSYRLSQLLPHPFEAYEG
ncbi:MAG: cytidine deaminase [Oscillospiraceae bacterium]|jgi:cytidine deaminase|nr:cytidine deaminase [Oscillospiraceae bacterium]